jgi:hypothetical protein
LSIARIPNRIAHGATFAEHRKGALAASPPRPAPACVQVRPPSSPFTCRALRLTRATAKVFVPS